MKYLKDRYPSEFGSYTGMKQRCYNPNSPKYPIYGGRGITICDRWIKRGSFRIFLEDMGVKPSPEHTIDRIDNDGDYTPENCHWATKSEQAINRRRTRFYEFNGQRLCIAEWSKKSGIKYRTLHQRLNRGLSIEKALQ